MDLTARDIHEKQFHDSWRGYNQGEVDDFLDRVAEVLDRLQRENAALHARNTELDHAVATSRDTEEMLKKTLITAQQAAEEAIASAKAKAEALIQEAEERTQSANRQADQKLQEADAEVRRKSLEADRELTVRRRELDASIARLRDYEHELRQRLKTFLQQQMGALEEMPDPEPPAMEPTTNGNSHHGIADEPTQSWSAQSESEAAEGSEEGDDQEGDEPSWEEPGFVRSTDLRSLYDATAADQEQEDAAPKVVTVDEADTLAVEEGEGQEPEKAGRRLFWRGDD